MYYVVEKTCQVPPISHSITALNCNSSTYLHSDFRVFYYSLSSPPPRTWRTNFDITLNYMYDIILKKEDQGVTVITTKGVCEVDP